MLTTEEIKNQLASDEVYTALNEVLQNILLWQDINAAYFFNKGIEKALSEKPDFSQKFPARYAEYQNLLARAKFMAVSILKDLDVIKLFSEHWKEQFEMENYDLMDAFRRKLAGVVLIADRDTLKQRVRQALLNNEQMITSKKITIKILSENKEVNPTVANWLKDYNQQIGGGQTTKVEQARYLTVGKNINLVDSKEREILTLLFQFYEFLKISSFADEGIEEKVPVDDNGQLKIFNQGQLEEVNTPEIREIMKKLGSLEEKTESPEPNAPASAVAPVNANIDQDVKTIMRQVLLGSQEEQERYNQLKTELLAKAKNDAGQLINDLKNKQTPEELVARLELIAQLKSFVRLVLEVDAKIRELNAENFVLIIKKFLADLPEAEQTRHAMKLALILKQQGYQNLSSAIYFDQKEKVFKWHN